MSHRHVLLIATGLLSIVLHDPAFAGPNQNAAISFHINSSIVKNPCNMQLHPASMRVSEPQLSTPEGPFYFVFLFVCRGADSAGVGGLECGVSYPGAYAPEGGASPINVFGWALCADLEFPSSGWPAPGGGNLMTWTEAHCHHPSGNPGVPNEAIALAGYFYVGAYASGRFTVIPRPVSGRLKVASCDAVEDDLTDVPTFFVRGAAGFGDQQGYNVCHPIDPVEETTWGRLKQQYR